MTDSKFPFNIIIVIFLVFATIGLYWLDRLGLSAGSAYLWLIFIGVVFIAVAVIAHLRGYEFWFEIPINKTSERGILVLVLGIVFLLGIIGILNLTGLQVYSPFLITPLSSFSLSIGAETFSALQAATSPFWTFFISVLSAATVEEIVLGFAFVLMGSLLLGYGLRSLLKLDFGDFGNEMWDFVMAITFSIIMFSVLHYFNGSYLNVDGSWDWSKFGFAASFRLILNILMYKFGNLGLLFGIGVHATNNALYLGGATVLSALTTFPGGVILVAIMIILVVFAILSIKQIIKEGDLVAKDFLTFD